MVVCLYPNGITNEYNLLGAPELCLRLRVNAVDLGPWEICIDIAPREVLFSAAAGAALKRAVANDGKAKPRSLRDKTNRQAASASCCHSLLGSSISLPPIASNSVARS